jgi:hypothetical protein
MDPFSTIYLLGAGAYMGSRLVKLWQIKDTNPVFSLPVPVWMKVLGSFVALVGLTAIWPITVAVSVWAHYKTEYGTK